MDIETINDVLLDALQKSSKISVKNPQIPILEYVFIECVDENTLRFTGYNLDIYYIQDIFVKTIDFSKKSFCISTGVLISYLQLFDKNEKVNIIVNDNNIIVKVKKQKSIINIVDSKDYPKNNDFTKSNDEGVILSIKSDIIIDGVNDVSFAASVLSIKPELACVLLNFDIENKSLIFVSTDGFRLAEKKFFLNDMNIDQNIPILIPAKIINDVIKVLYKDADIKLNIKKGYLCIESVDNYIYIRTIQGNYPNYKAIFPKEFATNFEIDVLSFTNALKASNLFSDDYNYVKMSIESNEMIFNSKNQKSGESNFITNIDKKGEDMILTYNHRYLSDFINKVKSDKVIMNISGKTTPTIINIKDDNSYTYLVMPMNK